MSLHRSAFMRYVAQAFLRKKQFGEDVNHLDFDPTNNKVENLEIVSRSGNLSHSMQAGRMAKKLDRDQILQIKYALAWGERGVALARQFGVTRENIYSIARGKTWGWVSLSDLAEHD